MHAPCRFLAGPYVGAMAREGRLYRIAGIGEIAVNVRTNYTAPSHTHDTYSIGIFKGPAGIWCRGDIWKVETGHIVLLEPGEAHGGTQLSRTCSQDGILPDEAFMVKVFGAPRPFRISRHIVEDRGLANRLSHAAANRNAAGLRDLLFLLLERYGERVAPGGEPSSALPLSINIASSVASDARAQGFSRSHFSRKLKAQRGLSPIDMRRQLRVARARAMIERGQDLASAALEAGFADQAHMTRQLRSLLGVTPSDLQRVSRER